MHFEKIGRGLLQEAFRSEGGGSALLAKRKGEIRKYQSWKMQVNNGVLKKVKTNAAFILTTKQPLSCNLSVSLDHFTYKLE